MIPTVFHNGVEGRWQLAEDEENSDFFTVKFVPIKSAFERAIEAAIERRKLLDSKVLTYNVAKELTREN